MGLFDSLKNAQAGTRAYRLHTSSMQLRKEGKYAEAEAKLDEALPLYEAAYQAGEKKFSVLRGYTVLLMRRGQFEKAREVMLHMQHNHQMTNEDKQQLRIDFAICQWKMGRGDKAIETLKPVAAVKKNGTIYNTMGFLLVEQASRTGDFEEADAWMKEAYDYDDEDAETLDNMGQLAMAHAAYARQSGDGEAADAFTAQAMEYLKKAYKEKPTQLTSAYFYAKLLHESGDDDKARKVLTSIRDIPVSAMVQVTSEQIQELIKAVG